MKKNIRHFLNKISVALLFLAAFVFVLQNFYTKDLKARQIGYSRELAKFVVTLVDERMSALPAGAGKSGELAEFTGEIVRSVADYFEAEELARILVFDRRSLKVIYPFNVSETSVEAEIVDEVSDRLEGELELEGRFGYLVTMGKLGITLIVYTDTSDLFSFHSKTLYVTLGLLVLFCLTLFLMDARVQRRFSGLLKRLRARFDKSFVSRRVLLDRIEEKFGRQNEPVLRSYNDMTLRAGNLVRSLEEKIRSLGQQRNNLKKLIVLYRKYAPSENLLNLTESTVGETVSRRQKVSSLSIELVDFLKPIDGLYPEVIAKELSWFHGLLKGEVTASGGIVNFTHGYLLNLVYGIPNPDAKSFLRAVQGARKALDWVNDRNTSQNNLSGVKWEVKMGLSLGTAVTGAVGDSYMVLGGVIEASMRMLELAKTYGVPLITDHQEGLESIGAFRNRRLDLDRQGGGTMRYIYEIFLKEADGVEDAIKLYYHGLDMFLEGRYEIAALDFKKVNQLFGSDNPSLLFLQRCEKLARR